MKFPFELGCGWSEFFDVLQFWVPLGQNWQDICILRHCIFTPSFVASGGDIFTSLSVLPQLFGFPILSWANAKKYPNQFEKYLPRQSTRSQPWWLWLFLLRISWNNGLEAVRTTLCVSICPPSSEARVTSAKAVFSLKLLKAPLTLS